MKNATSVTLGTALAVGVVVGLATCAAPPRMPALDGAVVEIRRSDQALLEGQAGYADHLQLYWFGTACHLIQWGGVSVLTDPFVTNDLRLFGMTSNPDRVASTLGRIPPPDAVVVNHSHHDHILDASAVMGLPKWVERGVPLYGGQSALHLLAGYQQGNIDLRWHAVEHGQRVRIAGSKPGYSAEITAYQSTHGPHLKCGFTLADGLINEPRTTPPRDFTDFQAGEVFNFLITLRGPGGVRFTVFYLGAPFHLDEQPECLPPPGTPIDVAIMLVPSAKNVRGYPQEHLARLRPRHIVLSHFNTFLKEDPDEQLAFGSADFVQMPVFSRHVQETFAHNARNYKEFEKVHIPAITVIEEKGKTRNVIRIR